MISSHSPCHAHQTKTGLISSAPTRPAISQLSAVFQHCQLAFEQVLDLGTHTALSHVDGYIVGCGKASSSGIGGR